MTKLSPFGADLIQAMSEALTHASGAEIEGAVTRTIDIAAIDAKAIRQHLKLTQDHMAMLLGISVSGYRKWEQGQRQPSGAARTLLKVMEKEPEAVLRALRAA
jgi:putative transcriptional regulator